MFSQRVGFFPPAATVSPFVGSEITTTTSIQYPFAQFSNSSMAYVGADPSNRPLFIFVYIEPGTTLLKSLVFRINDNGTISQSLPQTLNGGAATNGARTVAVTSTYQGAGSFGNQAVGTPYPLVWYSYINTSTSKLMAGYGSVITDQPTPTLAEIKLPASIMPVYTSDGDQPLAAFLGRRPATTAPDSNQVQYGVLFGLRTGSGTATQRFVATNGSGTLTAQGPVASNNGGQIDQAALGFAGSFEVPKTATVWHSGYWNTGGGAQTTLAGLMNSWYGNPASPTPINVQTSITTSPSILDTSVYNQACNLNNSTKFIGVSYLSPANTLNLTVVSVNWGSAGRLEAPTPTVGAFVSAGSAVNLPAVVSGFVADTALLVQSPAGSSSLTYADITVAGTVPTVGSTQTLFGGLSNCVGPPILATGKIGTKTYLAGIQARSGSNTPYVFGVRFT